MLKRSRPAAPDQNDFENKACLCSSSLGCFVQAITRACGFGFFRGPQPDGSSAEQIGGHNGTWPLKPFFSRCNTPFVPGASRAGPVLGRQARASNSTPVPTRGPPWRARGRDVRPRTDRAQSQIRATKLATNQPSAPLARAGTTRSSFQPPTETIRRSGSNSFATVPPEEKEKQRTCVRGCQSCPFLPGMGD